MNVTVINDVFSIKEMINEKVNKIRELKNSEVGSSKEILSLHMKINELKSSILELFEKYEVMDNVGDDDGQDINSIKEEIAGILNDAKQLMLLDDGYSNLKVILRIPYELLITINEIEVKYGSVRENNIEIYFLENLQNLRMLCNRYLEDSIFEKQTLSDRYEKIKKETENLQNIVQICKNRGAIFKSFKKQYLTNNDWTKIAVVAFENAINFTLQVNYKDSGIRMFEAVLRDDLTFTFNELNYGFHSIPYENSISISVLEDKVFQNLSSITDLSGRILKIEKFVEDVSEDISKLDVLITKIKALTDSSFNE